MRIGASYKSCLKKFSISLALFVSWAMVTSASVLPPFSLTDEVAQRSFVVLPTVLKENFKQRIILQNAESASVKRLCEQIEKQYKSYKWDPALEGCGSGNQRPWKTNFQSQEGWPLLYAEFGKGSNTTLILGGVHPDEITPIPLVFRFALKLSQDPSIVPPESRVVIAPLVNPDGFFKATPTRTNNRGVDLNRNFFTQDWYASAKSWWAERRQRNNRHFPGHIPNSEIETLFQIWLIDQYKPDKIISIHAPLGFYDYDGPGDQKPRALTTSEQKAKALVQKMSDSSRNYRIVDYSFYPGSLGNYAGNERAIPTITLELETTDPSKSAQYWSQFSPSLEQAIRFPFVNQTTSKGNGASLFLGPYDSVTATGGKSSEEDSSIF